MTNAGFWTGSISYTDAYGNVNAVNLGTVDSNNIFWYWLSITGWDGPDTSGSVIQRTSDHGGWPTPQYLAPRNIVWTIYAQAPDQPTRDLARKLLEAAVPINKLATFTYNEPTPKQVMVRRQGVITEQMLTTSEVMFTVTLVAPDPRKYATTQRNLTVNALATPSYAMMKLPQAVAINGPNLGGKNLTTSGTSVVVALTGSIYQGDGVLVTVQYGNNVSQTVTCADTQSSVYTQGPLVSNGSSNSVTTFTGTAAANLIAGTDTVTVTTTHSEFISVSVYRIPNLVSFSSAATASGSTSAVSFTGPTPTTGASFTLAVVANNGTAKLPVPTGWTKLTPVTNASLEIDAFYITDYTPVAQSVSGNLTANTGWANISTVAYTSINLFSGATVVLPNNGNIETRPIITVYGPVTSPSLTSSITGQSVTFTGLQLLSTADVLTIDFDNKTATRNGSIAIPDVPSSWWEIPPGGTNFIFGGQFGTGSLATVSYRDAYI